MEHTSPDPSCSAPGLHLVAKAATLLTIALRDALRVPCFNVSLRLEGQRGPSKENKDMSIPILIFIPS